MFQIVAQVPRFEVKRLLRQFWDHEVKLINVHDPSWRDHPWSHVMVPSTMDSYEEDEFVVNAREYLRSQIEDYGISLTEWMALSSTRKRQLIDIKVKHQAEKARSETAVSKEVERLMRNNT